MANYKGKMRRRPSKNGKREQPQKDSSAKRVNFDNTRMNKFEKDAEKFEKDHSNDVAWYSRNPELLRAAGSVAFSDVVGQQLPFTNQFSTSVPGVMAIQWKPSLGGFGMNAVNQAKQDIYSFVVHANSRNQSYDPNDLMLVILAAKDVFCAIGAMIRAYGTMKKFSGINMYTPQALVTAMGFDYDDLVSNLAEMWFDINEMIARSSQLWIPNNIPLVARQFWMNSNVYYDANSPKAQYYLYVQSQFLAYRETDFEDGGSLRSVSVTNAAGTAQQAFNPGTRGATFTWKQWKEAVNYMFDQLLNSQDRGIMLGDVLKAYGPDKIYSLSEIPATYNIEYSYNPEVLSQFENTTIMAGVPAGGVKQDLTRNTLIEYEISAGALSTPISVASGNVPPQEVIMNFHGQTQPTPEQIMVASRMMNAGPTWQEIPSFSVKGSGLEPVTTKQYGFKLQYCGTEIAVDICIYYYKYDVPTADRLKYYSMVSNEGTVTFDESYVALWSAFDWAPWYYVKNSAHVEGASSNESLVGMRSPEASMALGDYDMYCIITADVLRKLHTTAVYSEFGVPVMG